MSDDGPSDTMRERAAGSTAKLWLLLRADRRLFALGVVAFLFVGVVAGGLLHPTPVQLLITDGDRWIPSPKRSSPRRSPG